MLLVLTWECAHASDRAIPTPSGNNKSSETNVTKGMWTFSFDGKVSLPDPLRKEVVDTLSLPEVTPCPLVPALAEMVLDFGGYSDHNATLLEAAFEECLTNMENKRKLENKGELDLGNKDFEKVFEYFAKPIKISYEKHESIYSMHKKNTFWGRALLREHNDIPCILETK